MILVILMREWCHNNNMNSECSYKCFIVFFCCGNFWICVCWEEKVRYVVMLLFEIFVCWKDLVCC